jgi:hypothetical protein
VDGKPLKYYGNWTTSNATTRGLLKDQDGMCGAWGAFFLDCLRAQGLSVDGIEKNDPNNPNKITKGPWVTIITKTKGEWFLVKNWQYVPAGTKPGEPGLRPIMVNNVTYGYANLLFTGDPAKNIPADSLTNFMAGSRKEGKYLFENFPNGTPPDVDGNIAGIPGQNNPKPFSMFPDHVMIWVGDTWYDPSYGKKYNKKDFSKIQADCLAGYAFQRLNPNMLAIRKVDNNTPIGIDAYYRSEPNAAK